MTIHETIDCAVIGAGVVGLAVARALALAGREVVILEAEDAFGTQTSARNSEVIHAGIYYPPGSLKARTCVAGRKALYAYLAERNIAHKRIGKLIVATTENEAAGLEALRKNAEACGVTDLRVLSAKEATALEPELHCIAALLSPSTGIVDSHGYMLSLLGDAEAHGAMLARNAPVISGAIETNGVTLLIGGDQPMTLSCRLVVNSAGLNATKIPALLDGFPKARLRPLYLAKGNYFALSGRGPFRRLVYPVPEPGGLGIHYTLDMGGQARFGPDVEWIDTIDYSVDHARGDAFYKSIRRYFPALADGALTPGFCGIRPKLARNGASDFVIEAPAQHRAPGLINLYGIESPGLTASLALADLVVAAAEETW